jgi:hypothetical protein
MGIIPAAALDAVASYAAEALSAPLPVAIAAVLAVLTVVGLRLCDAAALRRVRIVCTMSAVSSALAPALPRLSLRATDTRSPRPAAAPAVAAWGLLRGPPGEDSRSARAGAGRLPG